MTPSLVERIEPGRVPIRDTSLYVDVVGHGYPLLLMHGGPSADHWTLGALEYALRYPDRLSHLVLLDTGADSHWARQNAPDLLAKRGYSPEKVELARRWFSGDITPEEYASILMRIGSAYCYHPVLGTVRSLMHGGWRVKVRPEALIFAGRHLFEGWTVKDRLGEITAPTLVLAGRDDFVFPPECQRELAAGIPNARLRLIERAGHNPHDEQTTEVMQAVRDFLSADMPAARPRARRPRSN